MQIFENQNQYAVCPVPNKIGSRRLDILYVFKVSFTKLIFGIVLTRLQNNIFICNPGLAEYI